MAFNARYLKLQIKRIKTASSINFISIKDIYDNELINNAIITSNNPLSESDITAIKDTVAGSIYLFKSQNLCLYVDFGSEKKVWQIQISSGTNTNYREIEGYELQLSLDGINYTTIKTVDRSSQGTTINDTYYFLPPKGNKTNFNMDIGDSISCEYTANTNTFGTFANLGKATKPEIPVTSSNAPDGTFYWIMVGHDSQGRIKLVADRNIQHSISWDALNTAGVASGSGLPIKIDNKDCIVRLLTGGINANDKNNEWDKIICESTLNDIIVAGDNNIWNKNQIYSWTSTVPTNASVRIVRGGSATNWNNSNTSNSTSNVLGFRPVLLVEPLKNYYLFLKEDKSCFAFQENAICQVASDWMVLTDEQKKDIFLNASQELPAIETLKTLGKFKILCFSLDKNASVACNITAVPQPRIVLPKGLIPLSSFDGIDKINITANLSGAGELKILVTTDLKTYKTWDGTAWQIVDHKDINTVYDRAMTIAQIAAINRTAWDALTQGKTGIGFSYLLTIESARDKCAVDKLEMQVDMKGSWDKALHGTDYNYGYPHNNVLRVTIKTSGDYKINYSEGVRNT